MDIAQLFNPVEKITGIEISRGFIRATLLEKNKKGVLTMVQKSKIIPPGVIQNGALANKELFVQTLKSFRHENADVFKSKYIILALPSAFTYTDIVKFPQLAVDQIAESVKLNLNTKTLFPLDANDIYYDWQQATSYDLYHREILLSFAPKKEIKSYLEAFETAGLEPLAFETPGLAIARATENFKDSTGLVIRITDEGIEFDVIARNQLHFSRYVQMPEVNDLEMFNDFLKDETYKVLNFYAIEYPHEPEVKSAILLSTFDQKTAIADYVAKQNSLSIENIRTVQHLTVHDAYGVSYGAALRGLIKREDDTLISLMPIGTEETYKKRRFLSYISLWSDIVNTTSVLLVLLFAGMWFFINVTAKKTDAQLAKINTANAVSSQITDLEEKAVYFNALLGNISGATQNIFSWSQFILLIMPSLAHDNIVIHNISMPSSDGVVSVGITAATRETAIEFRKALEKNALYESVQMPALGVTQKENISLVITLKTKPLAP